MRDAGDSSSIAGPAESVTRHVVFCASASFLPHVAVAAASLASSNPRLDVHLHVLTCDSCSGDEGRLAASLRSFPAVRLDIRRVAPERVSDTFTDERITRETYLRLLAPDVLDAGIGRALYLDCDLVVLGDLRSLFDADLGDCPLGAVPDLIRLLLQPAGDPTYVNAGVLVIDLDRWRREGLTETMLAYAGAHRDFLEYHDQDVINHVLKGRIRLLDFRWNVHADVLRFPPRLLGAHRRAVSEARAHPAIVHYTGAAKPWQFRSQAAAKRQYFRYQRLTDWRGACPADLGRWQALEYRADRLLLNVGIDRQRFVHVAGRLAEMARRRIRGSGD